MDTSTAERRVGDPDPSAERRERKRKRIVIAVVLAVAIPCTLYFGLRGTYDRWQDSQSLSSACRGSLEKSKLNHLLGSDSIRGKDVSPDGDPDLPEYQTGTPHRCTVSAENGKFLNVSLDWGAHSRGGLYKLIRDTTWRKPGIATPIGHGWHGVVSAKADRGVALVVMSCSNKKPNASLIVTLDGMFDVASTSRKTSLGFTAAHTAERAAKAWGCTAKSGDDRVNAIPGDKSITPDPAGKSQGTCKGLNTSTLGTPTDTSAPIEVCFVQAKDGLGNQYDLGAYYPPFNSAYDRERDLKPFGDLAGGKGEMYWGSAICGNGQRARYVIDQSAGYDGQDRDGSETFSGNGAQGKKLALKEFATRSAKRHGCTDLKLP
ncbi:hypothetical protein ABR737_14575 [Streptomyces sp. Edi2]|uniref:hypothetical protein n=1 Tax=Streptomyces sp. Edi2 TaxID=3162528 RepID=UPI0033062B5E